MNPFPTYKSKSHYFRSGWQMGYNNVKPEKVLNSVFLLDWQRADILAGIEQGKKDKQNKPEVL